MNKYYEWRPGCFAKRGEVLNCTSGTYEFDGKEWMKVNDTEHPVFLEPLGVGDPAHLHSAPVDRKTSALMEALDRRGRP